MNQDLEVHLIPILSDNYTYCVHLKESNQGLLIDPGEAAPVLDFLKKHSIKLLHIWLTHFHSDHINGVLEIQEATQCQIVGPLKEADQIPYLDHKVSDLDLLHFGSHKVKVLEVPGHTLGHVAYWFYKDDLLFCGDTLFSLGCGFLFEGAPKDMWCSLQKLRALPPDTLIYCGHEYTEQNAAFALSVDPDNQDLIEFTKQAHLKRSQGKPTLPTVLKDEIMANPFLRADLPYWKKLLDAPEATPTEIFQILRERKNEFK